MTVFTASQAGNLTYRSPAVTVAAGEPMTECSGIGVSRLYGATVWAHDDSGDAARLFAYNTTSGTLRRTFQLVNPANSAQWTAVDFEDMCLLQRPSGPDMLFVFDMVSQSGTGAQTLYRLNEPNPTVGAATQNVPTDRIFITFPEVCYSEGMFVDPLDGHLIVFKSNKALTAGVPAYRSTVPVTTATIGATVTMTTIATLTNFAPTLGADTFNNDWIGAADISPDRTTIAVHSTGLWSGGTAYDRIFLWQIADPLTTTIAAALTTTPILATNDGTGRDVISEQQGESIGFMPGSDGYMRISEGNARPIHIFDDTTPAVPPPAPIQPLMPDGRNFSLSDAQLSSTATHQWATWVTQAGGQMVGRRSRDSHTWTTHSFAGANATTLSLPYDKDDHNSTTITVDNEGRAWMCGNMHADGFRGLRTTNADGNVAGPWQSWALTGSTPQSGGYTYPKFCKFSDGTIIFSCRNGISPNGDYELFRKPPTGTTWTFLGKLLKGTNFSPPWTGGPNTNDTTLGVYPNRMFVEPAGWPHPDRIHCAWLWRVSDIAVGDGNEESAFPSYIYSDDKGTTWKSINGTTMTTPIQVNTNPACQCNSSSYFWPGPGPTGNYLINGGSLTIAKNTGFPWFTFGSNPPASTRNTLIHWDGSAWQWEQLIPGAVSNVARSTIVWFRDALWVFAKDPNGTNNRVHLYAYNTTERFKFGGDIPVGNPNPDWADNGSNFFGTCEPNYDAEAYRRFGTIEMLIPAGNTPKVFSVGAGALTR